MIREIKYTILDDSGNQKISPVTKQWAGMQYENNATKVIFDISALIAGDEPKITNPVCRIDFNSSSAGYDPSKALDIDGDYISREIPAKFTQYGGEMQITAVITEKETIGAEITDDSMVCYSFPVTVFFTAVKKEAHSEAEVIKNISAIEEEFKEVAEDSKNEIDTAVETAKSEIQDVADSAYTNIDNRVNDFESYAQNQIINIDSRVSEVREAANDSETSAIKAAESEASAQESAESAETAHQETLALKYEVIKSAPKIYTGTQVGGTNTSATDYPNNPVNITASNNTNADLLEVKIGDIYINTTRGYVYQCIKITQQYVGDVMERYLQWKGLNYNVDTSYNSNSHRAQSGKAVAEAVSGKESKSNKVTDLTANPEELTDEQYPTALATFKFVNDVGSGLSTSISETHQMAMSIAQSKADKTELETKEDKSNKVSSMYKSTDEANNYPNVAAIREYNNSMAIALQEDYNSKLNGKVDKEEGKTLYRGMELIAEYTFTGEETSKAVYFSKDKNGNDFKLDEVSIKIDLGSSVSIPSGQAYSCYVNEETISECMFYKSGNGNSVRHYHTYAKRCANGYWFNIGYLNAASATYNGQIYYNYEMSAVDYIYKLKVSMPLIQAGAKVKIYGRRVD